MKKVFLLAVFALVLGLTAKAYAVSLVDVPSGHWAEDAVQKLVDMGLIEGYPDGTFKGDRPMTRYEYAMVVARFLDAIDKKYCTVDKCKGGTAPPIDDAGLLELKDIVKKLAAEFKDELAALKVKVDDQGKRIDDIEKRISQPMIGKLMVAGSLRQRVDIPSTDLSTANIGRFMTLHYNATTAPTNMKAGYQAYPVITFTGNIKPNAKVNLQLAKYITNDARTNEDTTNASLAIDYANVELDFTQDVKELDLLKVTTGYQNIVFGPLGMLVDNSGLTSSPAVALAIGKDVVSITGGAGFASITPQAAGSIGAEDYDPFVAARLGINLDRVKLGVNFLANGYQQEKGWSGDIDAKILLDSPFLKAVRGEYLSITDSYTGNAWGTTVGTVNTAPKDYAYTLFVDAYKTKRVGLTVGFADTPAVPALTSLDSNPFTAIDSICALGTDYPNTTARPCASKAYESGRMLFPGGFKGLGLEASYKVLGDVTLKGKAVVGDYAGGAALDSTGATVYARGMKYPGYGSLSVSKPINSDTTFTVEYMQQGKNPILLNRVRGELRINF